MGGTGGPGSDQTMSQQGLIGAGLLAGSADEQAAKSAALGVTDAAQPTSTQLMGSGEASSIPVPMSAASPAAPVVTPTETPATGPPTVNFGDPGNTGAAGPTNPAFALAGMGNLGFPTGVTDDMPLGAYTHVPFGTKTGDTATTGPAITGAPITGPAADTKVFKGGKQIWPPTDGSTEVKAWLDQHPNYNSEVGADKSKPYQHADMTWWLADEGSDPTLDPKYVPPSFWPYATWGKY